jgi:hypothetical protein
MNKTRHRQRERDERKVLEIHREIARPTSNEKDRERDGHHASFFFGWIDSASKSVHVSCVVGFVFFKLKINFLN